MRAAASVELGAEGALVLPPRMRWRHGWAQGTVLILTEAPEGVLLVDRASALRTLREGLAGTSLVEELIAERRAAAQVDLDGV